MYNNSENVFLKKVKNVFKLYFYQKQLLIISTMLETLLFIISCLILTYIHILFETNYVLKYFVFNYFLLSIPISMPLILRLYFVKNINHYWLFCCQNDMFDHIFCINHIFYHKTTTAAVGRYQNQNTINKNVAQSPNVRPEMLVDLIDDEKQYILEQSSDTYSAFDQVNVMDVLPLMNIRNHFSGDEHCLKCQFLYFQCKTIGDKKELIADIFSFVNPQKRFLQWLKIQLGMKVHKKLQYFRQSVGKIEYELDENECSCCRISKIVQYFKFFVISLYVLSRIVSLCFLVAFADVYLMFIYDGDFYAEWLMIFLLSSLYFVLFAIFIYYAVCVYCCEYNVGYINDATVFGSSLGGSSVSMVEWRVQNARIFYEVMKINEVIWECIQYTDIALIIICFIHGNERLYFEDI